MLKETKDLLKVIIQTGNATSVSIKDGLTSADLPNFFAPIMLVPEAINGIEKIGEELKTMTEADRTELVEFIKTELVLENKKIEEIVEDGLAIIANIYSLILKLKN